MMKNADMPAMPQTGHSNAMGDTYVSEDNGGSGLTKREHFAAMAMQGMLSNPKVEEFRPVKGSHDEFMAKLAIDVADALLDELEKTP